MNKKCAICFSGQVRTGERKSVKNNLLKNLINPLIESGYDLYYFFSCERLFEGYDWSGYSIIKDENYWKEDLDLFHSRIHPHIKGGAFNVMNQWKKCQEVSKKKIEFEIKNKFKFDLVIRTRPDIILESKINYNTLDLSKFNIPNHDNWWGYNDRFCIGNSNIMDYYMNTFVDNIKNYFSKEDVLFHSETLLKHHLDKLNVGINRLNFSILFEREKGPAYDELCFN
jgi:hypothetical protein